MDLIRLCFGHFGVVKPQPLPMVVHVGVVMPPLWTTNVNHLQTTEGAPAPVEPSFGPLSCPVHQGPPDGPRGVVAQRGVQPPSPPGAPYQQGRLRSASLSDACTRWSPSLHVPTRGGGARYTVRMRRRWHTTSCVLHRGGITRSTTCLRRILRHIPNLFDAACCGMSH